MNFYDPVGPLAGKSTYAVVVWLAAWLLLHWLWRGREVDVARAIAVTLILIGVGLVGTFPPFYELFQH